MLDGPGAFKVHLGNKKEKRKKNRSDVNNKVKRRVSYLYRTIDTREDTFHNGDDDQALRSWTIKWKKSYQDRPIFKEGKGNVFTRESFYPNLCSDHWIKQDYIAILLI